MKTDKTKLNRAKKRLEELKGFYGHLAAYIGVNSFISIAAIVGRMSDGSSFFEVLDFGTFAVWFFWGIGLFFHGIKVFSYNPIFSKSLEERQIQKFMEKDKQQAEKFR